MTGPLSYAAASEHARDLRLRARRSRTASSRARISASDRRTAPDSGDRTGCDDCCRPDVRHHWYDDGHLGVVARRTSERERARQRRQGDPPSDRRTHPVLQSGPRPGRTRPLPFAARSLSLVRQKMGRALPVGGADARRLGKLRPNTATAQAKHVASAPSDFFERAEGRVCAPLAHYRVGIDQEVACGDFRNSNRDNADAFGEAVPRVDTDDLRDQLEDRLSEPAAAMLDDCSASGSTRIDRSYETEAQERRAKR
jgi:hypothetical protein